MKNLDISGNQYWSNQLSLAEFKCLFDGSCTWNELLSFDFRGIITDDQDGQPNEYINEIVGRGYLSSLQKLVFTCFVSKNVPWNCLEKNWLQRRYPS